MDSPPELYLDAEVEEYPDAEDIAAVHITEIDENAFCDRKYASYDEAADVIINHGREHGYAVAKKAGK